MINKIFYTYLSAIILHIKLHQLSTYLEVAGVYGFYCLDNSHTLYIYKSSPK